MFTGAKGPWKTNSCFQTSLQSLPGSSEDEGFLRIQALLKMSGKVGTKGADFASHHILPTLLWLMLPYSVQWQRHHFGDLGVFFLLHQDTTRNRGDLGCELSVGCLSVTNGCVVPWSLSVDIAGAITMVYLCCIAAPQPQMGGSFLVLTSLASHSGLMVTLTPCQCEIKLILLR